jgi:hypothetical protein
MTPYYPARDGHPSIFALEAATKLSPLATVDATDERDAIGEGGEGTQYPGRQADRGGAAMTRRGEQRLAGAKHL